MITLAKRQLLGCLITLLFGAGSYLAVTEPVPVDQPPTRSVDLEVRLDGVASYHDGIVTPPGAHLVPVRIEVADDVDVFCHACDRCRPRPFWQRGPIRRGLAASARWLFVRRWRCR